MASMNIPNLVVDTLNVTTTLTATLNTAAQPNITSVGTLSSLAVTGAITSASLASTGDVSGATLTGTLSTAAQTNITSVGTLGSLAVTGAITSASLAATGDVSGATLTGTLATAAQTNITSVGTLGSLNVTGTVDASVGLFDAISVVGGIASASLAASGDVSGATLTGTLATAVQTNITSVGTLGSLAVTGAITGGTGAFNTVDTGGFTNCTLNAAAATLTTYWELTINGVAYKLQLYQ